MFAAVNRNKRGIALDLQKPEGARILRELAARSDVVVANFVPGVADRLGVGYEAVSAINPGIVYVGLRAEVEQPTYEAHGGRARMLGFPFRASVTPASIRRPAPLLGEHTAEVLTELLGLSPAEVAGPAEAGAIALASPS